MGSFSIYHWLIVLLVVVLIFGTKKLRNIGQDLGGAVKGFKEGMREAEVDTTTSKEEQPAAQVTAKVADEKASATTIDVQAKDSETK